MTINDKGLALLKCFEGCKLQAYQDGGGVWTIGWGATGSDIGKGVVWTQEQADARLAKDLAVFEHGVETLVKIGVSSDQFSSLVVFAYNVGLAALARSTLLKRLNAGDLDGAANAFLSWDMDNGKHVPGLLRRRQAERALFLS